MESSTHLLADELGHTIFGRRIRLRVLLWVLDQEFEAFNQTQAAQGIQYSSVSAVASELERLVHLDMLRKFARPTGVGAQNYRRQAHPFWRIAEAAREALLDAAQEPDGEARRPASADQ